ncbi:hypothetical protein FQN54_002195 [Arachnomyces sp. PD_36]|nr:hypothetical protein FQN54_002195 [Arachnomyces sp. PD_36]
MATPSRAMKALPDKKDIVTAYRHLYRGSLQAVRYSSPSRQILLRTLRSSFRSGSPAEYDNRKIQNTLQFLQRAAESAGIEHKIMKNLVMVRFWEQSPNKSPRLVVGEGEMGRHIRRTTNKHFEATLHLLNESLGLCLR